MPPPPILSNDGWGCTHSSTCTFCVHHQQDIQYQQGVLPQIAYGLCTSTVLTKRTDFMHPRQPFWRRSSSITRDGQSLYGNRNRSWHLDGFHRVLPPFGTMDKGEWWKEPPLSLLCSLSMSVLHRNGRQIERLYVRIDAIFSHPLEHSRDDLLGERRLHFRGRKIVTWVAR